MSYPINQKINPYQQQQLAMGVNTPQLENLQDVNTDTLVQKSVLKNVGGHPEDENKWLIPVLTVPIGGGMIYGMDKFNAACKGKTYEESLLGKISAWGDKVASHKLYPTKLMEIIDSGTIKTKKFFFDQIVDRSKILSAFFKTPSVPESPAALMMSKGTKSELAGEAAQKLEKYVDYGGTDLKIKINGEYTNDIEKIKLYFKDYLVKKAHTTDKGIEEIFTICKENEDKFIKVKEFGNFKKFPLLGRLFDKDTYLSQMLPEKLKEGLTREIHFSEYVNKIHAFADPAKNSDLGKTSLGKKLPRLTIRMLEGLTNGTAGGKFAVLLGAFFIADAVKKTIDAPNENGEKRKTFAENIITNIGMYMLMPFGINLMHKFGGLQYVGISKKAKDAKKAVEKYENARDKFNERAELTKEKINANGEKILPFKNKAEHKIELKKLKILKKGNTRINWTDNKELGIVKDGPVQITKKLLMNTIYKPLRAIFNTLTVGLGTTRPYIPENAGSFEKFIKKLPFNFKQKAGYPVRFIAFLFVIGPFTSKITAKISHAIFGRPAKSILDEGKESEKAKEYPAIHYPDYNEQGLVQPTTNNQNVQYQQPIQPNQNLTHNQDIPLQKKNAVTSNNQRTMVPTEQPKRRYIPSDEAMKVDPHYHEKDNDKANTAIAKSENAVKMANKHLHH